MDKDKAKELARIYEDIHKEKFYKQDSNPKPRTWKEVEDLKDINNKGGKHD